MNVYNEEMQVWEQEQLQKVHLAFCPKKTSRLFDPKQERLFKARKRLTLKWFWGTECKTARKHVQDEFRMQMKTKLIHGDYHTPSPHEYKTYGWETY